ncbi:PREDICTED: zinc finger protein 609-like, partial [Eurypyga helias]|uniref:zinc finger protein 609-like n=1 Tax=Eurypyga helias TaxID=54383 RepID=UPI000528666A
MSLSSGASGGKGIDANPVETYDSGDEWDIGVGNLIIDLDADLEKDQQKLEMSGSKEVGLPAPNAVATLPDNIKFVSPVPGPQGKEGKSKSKRSKSGKDSGKPTAGTSLFTPSEGAGGKKEAQGRSGDGVNSGGLVPAVAPKGSEKSAKASRSVAGSKKEKEGGSSKSKKERSEGAGAVAEKEPSVLQPLALAVRVGQYDGGQGTEPAAAEQLGSIAIDTGAALNPLGVKSELEDGEAECRQLKKVKSEKGGWSPSGDEERETVSPSTAFSPGCLSCVVSTDVIVLAPESGVAATGPVDVARGLDGFAGAGSIQPPVRAHSDLLSTIPQPDAI